MFLKSSELEAHFPIGKMFPHEVGKLVIDGNGAVVFCTRNKIIPESTAINKSCRRGKGILVHSGKFPH